jgi:hypothetical protein
MPIIDEKYCKLFSINWIDNSWSYCAICIKKKSVYWKSGFAPHRTAQASGAKR